MTVTESLVHVTVVAGPPVEIQVRVNTRSVLIVNDMASDTVIVSISVNIKVIYIIM